MLLIDGQQRVTTTQLLLIAILDNIIEITISQDCDEPKELIEAIMQFLFSDVKGMQDWLAKTAEALSTG